MFGRVGVGCKCNCRDDIEGYDLMVSVKNLQWIQNKNCEKCSSFCITFTNNKWEVTEKII